MMGKMRDLAKWVLYILIVAFVALMVVEWGADYSGLQGRSQTVVGSIEGQEISIDEFNEAYRFAYFNEKQRTGKELDDDEREALRGQVWESMIQQILLKKEIDRLKIRVSDEDVTNYVISLVGQQYASDSVFQTNGQFDMNKFNQVLLRPENKEQLVRMEYQARSQMPFVKLQDLITSSVIITEPEVREEYMQKNVKARIAYLSVPVMAFQKDSVEVSEQDMKAYYAAHREEFSVKERRNLNYILFSTEPTADDSAETYQRAEELKRDILDGADFTHLADVNSEDPSVSKNHGDLGYFVRGQMVQEFSDAAFAAQPGEIVGPVKTSFGLHLIKVIDKKKEKGVDQVHAAHILLKFNPSRYTVDNAYQRGQNFTEALSGGDFATEADKQHLQVQKTLDFTYSEGGQIPGVGVMQSAHNWAFNAGVGEISDLFFTPKGYYVFQVAEIKKAGYKPFEEVKEVCKARVELEKRKALARAYAEKIAPQVQDGSNFAQLAAADPQKILIADSTADFNMNIYIPKIGRAAAVTAAAFRMETGKTSGMLEAERGFYFIRVLQRTPFNEEDYAKQRPAIRNRLLQQKKRSVFNQWYSRLKEKADIQDHRYRFFRS